MHGIYTHIPETNYVPREYGVAAVLLFLFMVLISLVAVLNLLYFYISTFRSMCAVPNMAVFCSSLTSWFPGMLLTYFLNVFELVPVAPIITGITFDFYIPLLLLLLLLLTTNGFTPSGSVLNAIQYNTTHITHSNTQHSRQPSIRKIKNQGHKLSRLINE